MLKSFEPIIPEKPLFLILGSMPSVKSIEEGMYYANERNTFWPIVFSIFNRPMSQDKDIRRSLIVENNIALWDVLSCCEREGSSDSKIRKPQPNQIDRLLSENNSIKCIFFNGSTAQKYFKQFFPNIKLPQIRLESTSPANARTNFESKMQNWSQIKNWL